MVRLVLVRVSQIGAVQVGVLLEGALSVQVLLVGLFVLVDSKTSLKDNHREKSRDAADSGEPPETWLGKKRKPTKWIRVLVHSLAVRRGRRQSRRAVKFCV